MTNISFESLAEQINTELHQNEKLAPYGLKARVYENGIVQVQGIVDVLEEKRQVEELIWRFSGVKKVENNVTVCTDGGIDDEDVAFEVSEELQASPNVPDSVGVKVHGGEVQLLGNVNNQSEAIEAREAAERARGVKEVHSQLRLANEIDDTVIVNNIQMALLTELQIPPGKVKIVSDNGIITLLGDMARPQALLVESLVLRQSGVRDVKNMLQKENGELE